MVYTSYKLFSLRKLVSCPSVLVGDFGHAWLSVNFVFYESAESFEN
jgi:hypothetical protein